MQIAALQEDTRGVAVFGPVARPSDQPMQNEDNRLQRLDERMERVEKMLQKLLQIVSFAVFLLLFLVLAKYKFSCNNIVIFTLYLCIAALHEWINCHVSLHYITYAFAIVFQK